MPRFGWSGNIPALTAEGPTGSSLSVFSASASGTKVTGPSTVHSSWLGEDAVWTRLGGRLTLRLIAVCVGAVPDSECGVPSAAAFASSVQ